MSIFLANLAAGFLANVLSDGVGAGGSYILSNRDIDMKLRQSIGTLEQKQLNIEGAIERLTNDQALLMSLLVAIIQQYGLQSQIHLEGQKLAIITNPDDINRLNSIVLKESNQNSHNSILTPTGVFDDYHEYVKRIRGET